MVTSLVFLDRPTPPHHKGDGRGGVASRHIHTCALPTLNSEALSVAVIRSPKGGRFHTECLSGSIRRNRYAAWFLVLFIALTIGLAVKWKI